MMITAMKDISDMHAAVGAENLLATLESQCEPVVDAEAERLSTLLAARRFSATTPPPPERVLYRIGEATIATPGNLVVFYAQPKAGKTAFTGAALASTMESEGSAADTFDVHSSNAEGWPLLHFDTEQSPQHFHKALMRALQRAGRTIEPDWLHSFRVNDLPLKERRAVLIHEIRRRHAVHGGIHSIFLDGVADFIADVNDAEAAFQWVDELHQLAIRYDTVIICILHENPGSEIGKTRGHLGSQLERKAETNLRLVKDGDGVTVVFTERSRQAHIPRDQGPRFAWDPETRMHTSCQSKAVVRVSKRQQEQLAFAREVFANAPPGQALKWSEVLERIKSVASLSNGGARKRFQALQDAGVLILSDEGYQIQQPEP